MKPFNKTNPRNLNFQLGTGGFQGDIIIKSIELPKDFELMAIVPNGLVAIGDTTGHCHQLVSGNYELRVSEDKKQYLKVVSPVELLHQQHPPIVIGPGTYLLGRQKEYDHFEGMIREIVD